MIVSTVVEPLPFSDEIVNKMATIEWFKYCDKAFEALSEFFLPTLKIDNWQDAEKYANQQSWDETTLSARNAITGYLASNHKAEYKKWNPTVRKAKELMAEYLDSHIESTMLANNLTKYFRDSAYWCILSALMEDAYANYSPFRFYTGLFVIFERGHYPCGWIDGEFPNGTLIVY